MKILWIFFFILGGGGGGHEKIGQNENILAWQKISNIIWGA